MPSMLEASAHGAVSGMVGWTVTGGTLIRMADHPHISRVDGFGETLGW
jgi:hypothetical protein